MKCSLLAAPLQGWVEGQRSLWQYRLGAGHPGSLGPPVVGGMEGRILEEAMSGGPDPAGVEWSSDFYSTRCLAGKKVYRQQTKLSRVGDSVYVDEGTRSLGRR